MGFDYRKIGLKRIDTYIIKKFLGTYFYSIVLILSIAVVFDLTEKLDNFFDNNAPLKAIIFDYYMGFIPFYMNMFSPLFTFIAVIFFTSKMATNTEIIAILASGVSFRRLMMPYLISAAVISGLAFVLGGYVIPPANEKLLDFEDKYVKKFKSNNARNVQMEVEKGVILYIERYEISENRGYRFSLEKFDGKSLVSRLTAETITWDSAYNWKVSNYQQRDFNGMREKLTRGIDLDTVINVQPQEFFISSKESAQMNNTQLREYLKRQKNRGVGNIQAFEDEYYKRYSMPLAAFIMTLIGVSLSSRKVRGGMGLHLGIGLALSSLYILFSTLSTTFSVSGAMSPFAAVWLPNFVFLLVGIYLYRTAPK
ncbi:MAG: LptF/LptG family permease [Paludibacter sp.]|jgi:lipopolysaccharide export system permease protein|nr:LptF/LptG family permease [Paludibacter sp.]MBP8783459.1 LptF/LptG family permease [Paludibacter sp.]MDX9920036.1 LptF/LptG family permease [Paludibacter sp.]